MCSVGLYAHSHVYECMCIFIYEHAHVCRALKLILNIFLDNSPIHEFIKSIAEPRAHQFHLV